MYKCTWCKTIVIVILLTYHQKRCTPSWDCLPLWRDRSRHLLAIGFWGRSGSWASGAGLERWIINRVCAWLIGWKWNVNNNFVQMTPLNFQQGCCGCGHLFGSLTTEPKILRPAWRNGCLLCKCSFSSKNERSPSELLATLTHEVADICLRPLHYLTLFFLMSLYAILDES